MLAPHQYQNGALVPATRRESDRMLPEVPAPFPSTASCTSLIPSEFIDIVLIALMPLQ